MFSHETGIILLACYPSLVQKHIPGYRDLYKDEDLLTGTGRDIFGLLSPE